MPGDTPFDAALAALDVEEVSDGYNHVRYPTILGLDDVRAAHRAEVERAVAEEREACAKAARGAALVNYGTVREFDAVSQQREACSDAVRARGARL